MAENESNPKKRGLGRGLNALFEDEEGVYPQVGPDGHTPGRKRDMLGIEFLEPGLSQPRHNFDDKSLDELADSIKTHGLLQPILVRADKNRVGMYEIIAGERRWRAAQRAAEAATCALLCALSGRSKNTNFSLPVSAYSSRMRCTVGANAPQAGHW
jgi:ParB family chromosome partitioning protein